jgi:TPR repeat protein
MKVVVGVIVIWFSSLFADELLGQQLQSNTLTNRATAALSVKEKKRLAEIRAGAERGEARAQNDLGWLLHDGLLGLEKDYAQAVSWFRKAADQGYAHAQCNLGRAYEEGNGVNQDYAEAIKWFRKAAEQDHAPAQINLGMCYAKGKGVKKDFTVAAQWFRKAAEQGEAKAQNNLGYCYNHGLGVPTNAIAALKWFTLSANQGDEVAKRAMNSLERGLSAEEVAKGRELARNFKPVARP